LKNMFAAHTNLLK